MNSPRRWICETSVLLRRLARSARLQKQHPREYSGSHWCVLVSNTTPARHSLAAVMKSIVLMKKDG
ncbi:hypothetical protein MF573_27290 [Klebsiella pneumoniae]|nr:hypothetical protein MF573_27290 [Klebsiella pneumoniae]